MYQERDRDIRYIEDRGKNGYGMGLGIILLDMTFPGFPGDVRNPSAHGYPIQYEVARGLDIENLVLHPEDPANLDAILQAAKNLERMGCKAVLAECGYFAWYQKDVAAAVDIPVLMSSLLQVSWASQLIGPEKTVGLFMSMKKSFREEYLKRLGMPPGVNYVVGGAMDGGECTQFTRLWGFDEKRTEPAAAEYETAEAEFVRTGAQFYREHADMGAMVLECTGFPPFARALQREIGIPVFSWGTLMDFAYSVVVHRSYYGHM